MNLILYVLYLHILGYGPQVSQVPHAPMRFTKSIMSPEADTVLVIKAGVHELRYEEDEFRQLVEDQPEFFAELPSPPEIAYVCHGISTCFFSEAGQDEYDLLYAYFLKQRHPTPYLDQARGRLIEVYTRINELFRSLEQGGTYFGHMYVRIYAYAEYSVYLLSHNQDGFEKSYAIHQQKALYLDALRQSIADESSLPVNANPWFASPVHLVDKIDVLINDVFMLKQTQAFHYSHYEYV